MPDPTTSPQQPSEPAAAAAPAAPVVAPAAAAPAAQPAQPAAAKPAGAPEKYEAFKVPDGVTLAPELQTGIEAFARQHNFTQEHAQGLADFAATQLQSLEKAAQGIRDGWRQAAEKDSEIGGDKLAPALAAGAQVIDTFAGQDASEFKEYLNKTGLGNHPVLVKIFARVHAAISPDKFVPGNKAPAASDARTLYPNSNMNP